MSYILIIPVILEMRFGKIKNGQEPHPKRGRFLLVISFFYVHHFVLKITFIEHRDNEKSSILHCHLHMQNTVKKNHIGQKFWFFIIVICNMDPLVTIIKVLRLRRIKLPLFAVSVNSL